jgi:hypothetical protein
MYKPSLYLVITYIFFLPIYLPTYIWDLFVTELVTKVKKKPNIIINWVEVHPQLSYNGHPVDGALVVGACCSLWPCDKVSGQVFCQERVGKEHFFCNCEYIYPYHTIHLLCRFDVVVVVGLAANAACLLHYYYCLLYSSSKHRTKQH